MRYSGSPDPHPPGMVPPGFENKVMHMTLKIGDNTVMAADDCTGHPKFQGFSRSRWRRPRPTPFVSKLMQVFVNLDTMIGKDFEEGLANLKKLTEKS